MAINHWWFQLANTFLALSYLSRNLLFLRVCLTFASLCFVVWAYDILDFAVDTFSWNLGFLAINGIQTLIILYQMRPLKFSQEDEELYNAVFSRVLTKFQFLLLIQHAKLRRMQRNDSTLMTENEQFSTLYLVTHIGKNAEVVLYRNGKKVGNVNKFSFIGKLEFAMLMREGSLSVVSGEVESTITAKLLIHNDGGGDEDDYDATSSVSSFNRGGSGEVISEATHLFKGNKSAASPHRNDDSSIKFYRWDVEDIADIVENRDHGMSIMNALKSLMMEDMAVALNHSQNSQQQLLHTLTFQEQQIRTQTEQNKQMRQQQQQQQHQQKKPRHYVGELQRDASLASVLNSVVSSGSLHADNFPSSSSSSSSSVPANNNNSNVNADNNNNNNNNSNSNSDNIMINTSPTQVLAPLLPANNSSSSSSSSAAVLVDDNTKIL